MNCQNCGAAMTLFREREYYFCEYCGTFHFPSVSKDGVRLLGDAPDDVACPVCRVRLQFAALADRYHGYQCENCQGLLIDRLSFKEAVHSRRAWTNTPPEQPQPLNREELTRQIHCPTCSATMKAHPYFGPGNIVIDTCDHCHWIWLDYGELARAVNAPGRDRGAALREKEKRDERRKETEKQWKGRKKRGLEVDLVDLLDDLFF